MKIVFIPVQCTNCYFATPSEEKRVTVNLDVLLYLLVYVVNILRYTRVRTRRCAAYSGATRTWSRRRCLHRRHTSRHRCSQLLSNATITISSSSSSQRYVPWTAYQTTTWCSPDTLLTVSQSTVLNVIIFNIIAGVINSNESATYRCWLTVVYKLLDKCILGPYYNTPKYVFKYL